ncbi:hypothetical protein [Phenylobacterium sp.]|uniref:hypothetical protein n=1 Tax=Phenylobacterium sp. TaxID=1871053 RepID=UPI002B7CA3A3|nr:hypothetical protein [Phenylobacterium sp.]HVI30794.1 hypothetical protein [Phenylobacterium sp.]
MANRDDYRGYGGDRGRDRWRQDDDQRRAGGRQGGDQERRSFGDQGRFNSDQARYGEGWRGGSGEGEREPWRRDRYGSRFDQDRTGYGSGYDRDTGGYGRGQGGGYGGQEYGVEAGGRREEPQRGSGQRDPGRREFEQWRPHGSAPYGDLELNARTSGVEEFGAPHDYAYHPPQGHEFEPDYVHWREEQLRLHDRDYQEWRRHQHQQLDDEYRKFRTERRDTFGKNFHEWRSQRNMSTGMGRQDIAPGMHGQHRMAEGFGGGDDMPSGRLESPSAMTNSPSLTQTGGQATGHGGGAQGSGAAGGSEFGNTPPQVQAASDGGDTRRDAEDRKDGDKGHESKH